MKERWRQIKNFPNYFISNTGRIQNTKLNRELYAGLEQDGYKRVTLHNEDGQFTFLVHRLVAEAFIPNYQNKPTVNHIDCNKTNNLVENLEWADNYDQISHAYKNGLFDTCTEKKWNRHPPIKCVETGEKFRSQREFAKHLGINEQCLCLHLKGKISHAGGYHFEYVDVD